MNWGEGAGSGDSATERAKKAAELGSQDDKAKTATDARSGRKRYLGDTCYKNTK
jgi:hypothetical protein